MFISQITLSITLKIHRNHTTLTPEFIGIGSDLTKKEIKKEKNSFETPPNNPLPKQDQYGFVSTIWVCVLIIDFNFLFVILFFPHYLGAWNRLKKERLGAGANLLGARLAEMDTISDEMRGHKN